MILPVFVDTYTTPSHLMKYTCTSILAHRVKCQMNHLMQPLQLPAPIQKRKKRWLTVFTVNMTDALGHTVLLEICEPT